MRHNQANGPRLDFRGIACRHGSNLSRFEASGEPGAVQDHFDGGGSPLALDESLIATDSDDHSSECSVEHALRRRVSSVMEEIEQSLVKRLSETTISEVRLGAGKGKPAAT